MNYRTYIVFDFETGDKDVSKFENDMGCEPVQIAALAINPRNLTMGAHFESLMRPLQPELLQDEALAINHKTREQLAAAPHPEVVWGDFATFIQRFNRKPGDNFHAPVACGYNIRGFDMRIVEKLCQKYGPVDARSNKQGLFSNFMCVDLMDDIFRFTENTTKLPNMRLDTVRDWMGMSKENAHDALQDVRDTAAIMIRFMKFYRNLFLKTNFEGCFASASH